MPLIHEPRPAGPRVGVHASLAVELEWALATADRPDYRRDHAGLAAVYDRSPDLGDRVRSFWGRDLAMSCGGFLELMVLAHRGNLLFTTDAHELLGRLDGLCRSTSSDLELSSESDQDRAAVLARLDVLQTSPSRRRHYVELVGDVWTAVQPVWERDGRRAVDVAIDARRQLLAKGAPWKEVARGDCDYPELDQLVEALGPAGELAVVPAFFTHFGLLIDLPGVVLVGVRADASGAHARARTELLARRLKALSDPTRLAILNVLADGPRTITEIAQAFTLAQPTVSNHVKLLREAGLVASASGGARRELAVQHDAVGELLEHLEQALRAPSDEPPR